MHTLLDDGMCNLYESLKNVGKSMLEERNENGSNKERLAISVFMKICECVMKSMKLQSKKWVYQQEEERVDVILLIGHSRMKLTMRESLISVGKGEEMAKSSNQCGREQTADERKTKEKWKFPADIAGLLVFRAFSYFRPFSIYLLVVIQHHMGLLIINCLGGLCHCLLVSLFYLITLHSSFWHIISHVKSSDPVCQMKWTKWLRHERWWWTRKNRKEYFSAWGTSFSLIVMSSFLTHFSSPLPVKTWRHDIRTLEQERMLCSQEIYRTFHSLASSHTWSSDDDLKGSTLLTSLMSSFFSSGSLSLNRFEIPFWKRIFPLC